MSDKTHLEVLKGARELLSLPDGCGQGSLELYEGCYCTAGAINLIASGNARMPTDLSLKALKVFKRTALIDNVFDWNDAPDRTQAQVVGCLDAVIRVLSEEHRT